MLGRAAKRALHTNTPQTISRLLSTDERCLKVMFIPFSPSGGLPDHLLVQINEAETDPSASQPQNGATEPLIVPANTPLNSEVPQPSQAAADSNAATSSAESADQGESPNGLPKSEAVDPKVTAPLPTGRPVTHAESISPTVGTAMAPAPRIPTGEIAPSAKTPPTGPLREFLPLPRLAVAHDIILIADPSLMPIAKALVGVLTPTVKTKALPLGKFVSIFEGRAGVNAPPHELQTQLEPATRLVFLGNSKYATYVRDHSLRAGRTGSAGWAITGHTVRCSTIWTQAIPKKNIGDLIADAQFDIGQICYLAVPKKRNGRRQPVNKGLGLAGLFLEDPSTIVTHRTPREEAQHTLILLAVARWLKEGFEVFLRP